MESIRSCCIAMNNYTYTYACRNIFNTIKRSGQCSLEKYTSHFIERVVCERWVGDWTKTATYWPPAPPAIAVCLFRSPELLNRGPGGPASLLRTGSHSSIWNTDFKLWTPTPPAWLPVSPGLNHCFTPTQFNPSTVKVISWSFRPDAPVIYTGAFLIWQLGRVGGQYATLCLLIGQCVAESFGRDIDSWGKIDLLFYWECYKLCASSSLSSHRTITYKYIWVVMYIMT